MTSLAGIVSNTFVVDLGWFLLHALWQGTLIALALAAMLALIHERSSKIRYGLSVIALVLMPALPLLTAFGPLSLGSLSGGSLSGGTLPIDTISIDALSMGTAAIDAASSDARGATARRALMDAVEAAAPWLVPFWLAGVCLLTIRAGGGWWAARRLARSGLGDVPPAVSRSFVALKRRFGVTAAATIKLSTRIDVPAVIGYVRPVLLLPLSALSGLSPAQLDAVIAHELAHIRRHDYLVLVLQQLVEAMLFFHPATWWISSHVRREREHCCDDLAVLMCGDALSYATALLSLEERRCAPAPRLVMAATAGNLLVRVRRLLKQPAPHRLTPTAIVPFALLLLFGCLSLVAATGQQSAPSPAPVPAPVQAPAPAFNEVLSTFERMTDRAERKEFISRLSGSTAPEHWNALLTIAQSDRDIEIRKTAISYISGRPDVDTLSRLYDNASRRDLKLYLLSYIHGVFNDASRAKIQAIAASERDKVVRAKALDYLSGR